MFTPCCHRRRMSAPQFSQATLPSETWRLLLVVHQNAPRYFSLSREDVFWCIRAFRYLPYTIPDVKKYGVVHDSCTLHAEIQFVLYEF